MSWKLGDTVDTSVGRIAVDVFGEGPPVVLTHGTPAWSYLWRGVVERLARTHAVHVWDLPGYGDSTATEEGPSVRVHARALAELVEAWGLAEPALVGHDIGGATVLRAHLVEGVPVRALALVDAAVLSPWVTATTQHFQRHLDVYRSMPNAPFSALIAAHVHTASHRGLSAEAAESYLDRYAGDAGQQRYLDQVAGFTEDDTRDVVAEFGRISVPAHVFWGSHDTWLPIDQGRELAESIPGAGLTEFAGAGHFSPEDDPEAVATALAKFLA